MLAATGVLVSHAFPLALGRGMSDPIADFLGISLGTLCVYVFFVLSGFFIASSYERSSIKRQFISARVLRLFPALGVCLVITIIAGSLITTELTTEFAIESVEYFFCNFTLFYGQTNLPGVFENNPFSDTINGSLWTLNFELLCYVLTLSLGLLGCLVATRWFIAILLVFLALYLASFQILLPYRLSMLLELGWPYLIGTSLWVFRKYIQLSGPTASLALGIWITLVMTDAPTGTWIPFLGYLMIYLGYADASQILRYNSLGDYSYGVYIYAFPVQQLAAQFGAITPIGNIIYSFPITLLLAILSWHMIEKPALRLKNSPIFSKRSMRVTRD
jgi:peptidoglycan/LPS O-acetylase OafA/YrhL